MNPPHVIVIGGSAGALRPLERILAGLPVDLNATVFVVLHIAPYAGTGIAEHLARLAPIPIRVAADEDRFTRGEVLFAAPDHHLIVKPAQVRVLRTPRENLWRPSVDVLFRSAAVAHGAGVTGVILSGALDDGSAGLAAIKRCGGTAIVQSPAEAAVASMPKSAIRNAAVDHVVDADAIASLLEQAGRETRRPCVEIPEDLELEAQFAETGQPSLEISRKLGELSGFTCNECAGPLWKRHGDMLRFRCLTGHAMTARSLQEGFGNSVDESLWAAIRLFEQRANLYETMAAEERARGRERTAAMYGERRTEALAHSESLRRMLQQGAAHPGSPTPLLPGNGSTLG